MSNKIDQFAIASNSLHNISQSFIAIQQNMQNAQIEGASTIYVNLENIGGLNVSEFVREVDELKTSVVYEQEAETNSLKVLSQYYKDLTDILAKPGEDSGLLASFNDFFATINTCEVGLTADSSAVAILAKADALAEQISDTQYGIAQVMSDVSEDLKSSFDQVNVVISRLNNLNLQRRITEKGTMLYCEIEESISQEFNKLAEYFDFDIYEDSHGFLNALVNNGAYKIVGEEPCYIDYKDSSIMESFKKGDVLFSSVDIVPLNQGNYSQARQTVVSEGYGLQCISKLQGGKIGGLLKLRNIMLPALMERLDSIAYIIGSKINQVHNRGATSSMESMMGTHGVKNDATVNASGTAYIGLVDEYGSPIEVSGLGKIPAIDIQFSTIAAPGSNVVNIQAIVDEINALGNKTCMLKCGNVVDDMQLACMSRSLYGNTLEFDFDITFSSENDYDQVPLDPKETHNDGEKSFTLENLAIYDCNNNPVSFTLAGNSAFGLNPGSRMRSSFCGGPKIVIDGSGGALSEINYPLRLEVSTNVISNYENYRNTAVFSIPQLDESNLGINSQLNKRFSVTAVIDEDGKDVKSNDVSSILFNEDGELIYAEIIDQETGLPSTTGYGYLQITAGLTRTGVIVNSEDTILNGYTDGMLARRGVLFSDFFGLNDLYLINNKNVKNAQFYSLDEISKGAAKNFRLRNDIHEDAHRVCISKAYNNGEGLFYHIHSHDSSLVKDYQEMFNNTSTTVKIGDLPAFNGTMSELIAFFESNVAGDAANLKISYKKQMYIYNQLQDDLQNAQGIDVLEQLNELSYLSKILEANAAIMRMEMDNLSTIVSIVR